MAVCSGHEYAGRESVSMEDFGDQAVIDAGPAVPAYFIESMVPAVTPSGRPVRRGPVVTTFHEVQHAVATGQAVSPLNQHVLQYYVHPGIVLVPVVDAPPTEWALVWRTDDSHPRTRAFVEVAESLGVRAYAG